MRPKDLFRLIVLAAIWGSSFMFMRVVAPVLGPILTAQIRLITAGLVLIAYFRVIGFDAEWRRYWKHYLFIGVLASALPFTLYAFAARHIPASYSVILNSTTPLFGALFASLWLNERLTLQKSVGLVLGLVGVGFVIGIQSAVRADSWFLFSIGACLGSATCYALSGIYIKKNISNAKPMAIAGATQLLAGLTLIPALPFNPEIKPVTPIIIVYTLTLAILCSAIAYLLYYQLLANVGPTKALTVTFLMPCFGMFWGAIFLNEKITPSMICGCALIILGTWLVVNSKGLRRLRS